MTTEDTNSFAHGDDESARTAPAASAAPVLDRAIDLVRFLRTHCEWDAAQTPDSLLPYLLEEAHEVADAVADRDEHNLTAELGDLLLNVAFQIILAEERSAFSAEDVVRTLESKMRRRHPHLYGDGPRLDWEELKRLEREERAATREPARAASDASPTTADGSPTTAAPAHPDSILAGVPRGLDPLSRAHRIQDRVAAVGFDWKDVQGPIDKVAEELAEVHEAIEWKDTDALQDEIGDLLFAIVNMARHLGIHPTGALERANRKFTDRFQKLEALARTRDIILANASLEDLDLLWDEIKRKERGAVD